MIATIITVLVLLFLVIPILMIYPISFSPTTFIVFPQTGFSTKWYEKLFSDSAWMEAIQNSLEIAILTTVISMFLGVIVACAMRNSKKKTKMFLGEYFRLPQSVPIIVTAISIYALLIKIKLVGTVSGLVIAHTVVALPFVVSTLNAALSNLNSNFEDAAVSLGANRFRAFMNITLPMLRPAIGSSILFAFLNSFDEIAITLFVTGPKVVTIPKKMWDGIKLSIEPTLAAISALLVSSLILGFIIILIVQTILARKKRCQL